MKGRAGQVATWQKVLANLLPPQDQDPDGVPVPIQGIEYLAEIAEHFAFNHGGHVSDLANRWRELASINREHANKLATGHGKLSDEVHAHWRRQVLAKLNEIRGIVSQVFNVPVAEMR
jgi:hypothetical protein